MRTATKSTTAQRRSENSLIRRALRVLEDRLEYQRTALKSPQAVRDFLVLRLAELEHEVFFVMWLSPENELIAMEELFRGTLTQASVYPREMVKRALAHNAAGAILAHNHPSGMNTPSQADKEMSSALRQTLALVDVRVIDHFIVAGSKRPFSFAENGLL